MTGLALTLAVVAVLLWPGRARASGVAGAGSSGAFPRPRRGHGDGPAAPAPDAGASVYAAADALTLVALALHAGLAPVEALEAVAGRLPGAVGRDLAVVAAAHRWGRSRGRPGRTSARHGGRRRWPGTRPRWRARHRPDWSRRPVSGCEPARMRGSRPRCSGPVPARPPPGAGLPAGVRGDDRGPRGRPPRGQRARDVRCGASGVGARGPPAVLIHSSRTRCRSSTSSVREVAPGGADAGWWSQRSRDGRTEHEGRSALQHKVFRWGRARVQEARRAGEAGMTTAEYAVGTVAAVAFAGLLLAIVRSGPVRSALTSIIVDALHAGS